MGDAGDRGDDLKLEDAGERGDDGMDWAGAIGDPWGKNWKVTVVLNCFKITILSGGSTKEC